jgi:hypothetical protein
LFDSFGDEVDQHRWVGDDQCGLVNEFGFHEDRWRRKRR